MSSTHSIAEASATELRDEINALKSVIEQQQEQLNDQKQVLQTLNGRLEEVEANTASETPVKPGIEQRATQAAGKTYRDSIGDLNADAVKAGDFAGAIRLPNTLGVQLAIGGFFKTAVLLDSDAETLGVDFLPALLGVQGDDQDGNFALDSTLTRLVLDARAPARDEGQLRGYLEWDLNNANNGLLDLKTRLAYGSWSVPSGKLTVGQNWSTFMDLRLLPEGLTEPTVSGAIFVRQAQVQWSAPLNEQWTYHAALEDPSSTDFESDTAGIDRNTRLPDVVLGIEYNDPQWHWRANGIARKLEFDAPSGASGSASGWGLSASGRYNFPAGDWLGVSASYGAGLGRYLLGLRSNAGGAVGPDSGLELRDNWGAFVNYFHRWSETTRSTITVGHAQADPLDFQPASTFESSTYGAINWLWSPLPYVTMGVEYQYGKFEQVDGNGLDNNRISLAFQIF